jgi:PncC family amidohydrolase
MRLEEKTAKRLIKHKQTLSVAESCTGGFLANCLTNIPGSSAFFWLGIVAYDNAAKTKILRIDPALLKKHGAVSRQTVLEMLKGALKNSSAQYGIAVSGVAGPTGGTPRKPVGTIWFAVGTVKKQEAILLNLHYDRELNQKYTAFAGLQALRALK